MTILRLLFLLARLPGRLTAAWFDSVRRPDSQPLNWFMRGTISALTWFFAFVLVASAFVPAHDGRTTASAERDRVVGQVLRGPVGPQGPPGPMPASASSVQISRVIDGDTFELVSGQGVRVLGIDSCEDHSPKTPGGADATAAATAILSGNRTIELASQPGAPDKDRYGRLLRYVTVDGQDFGQAMVGYDHTGVYQGHNDASPTYVARLYAHDRDHAIVAAPAGRYCGETAPEVARDDGTAYVPVPDRDRNWHKPRACNRKWWC